MKQTKLTSKIIIKEFKFLFDNMPSSIGKAPKNECPEWFIKALKTQPKFK